MSTFIVFTGPATTRTGEPVLRADLKAFAQQHGYVVQTKVTARTAMLIASRADTVKARGAFDRGLTVQTYGAFIESLGVTTVPHLGGQFDPYADSLVPAIPALAEGDYL